VPRTCLMTKVTDSVRTAPGCQRRNTSSETKLLGLCNLVIIIILYYAEKKSAQKSQQ